MTENEPIKAVSDGITFLSTGRYYDGINQWVAHENRCNRRIIIRKNMYVN